MPLDSMPPQKRPRLTEDHCETESGSEGNLVKCFPMIFPYVPLTDLVILLQSCPFFGPLVGEFIDSGTHIRIDRKFVERFPVEDHLDLYTRLAAEKTSLTVSEIDYEQLQALQEPFERITHITFHKIKDGLDIPPEITSIKFSHCELGHDEVSNILSDYRTIRSLHLDHVTFNILDECETQWSYYLRGIQHLTVDCCDRQAEFNLREAVNLQSLTLACKSTDFDWNPSYARLNALYGFDTNESNDAEELPPMEMLKLEYLSIRGLQPEDIWNYIVFGESLTTFECHTAPIKIDKILQMKSLKHANVYCNWYHADQLKEHFASLESMESFTVTCCAPTPGYDLIRSLNEDCLREIVPYIVDHNNLLAVYPTMAQFLSSLTIDSDSLRVWPTLSVPAFYKQLARGQTHLKLHWITEWQAYDIIRYFPHLKKLSLQGVDLLDEEEVDDFPLISDLSISSGETVNSFAVELFRHLNPTLRRLKVTGAYFCAMRELTNLREFDFSPNWETMGAIRNWTEELRRFLNRNKKLARLTILSFTKDATMDLLSAVNPEALRFLDIMDYCPVDKAVTRLINLEELVVRHRRMSVNYVKHLSLPKLTALTISGHERSEEILEIVKLIPTLKKLTLYKCPQWTVERLKVVLPPYLKTQEKVVQLREEKSYGDYRRCTFSFSPVGQ